MNKSAARTQMTAVCQVLPHSNRYVGVLIKLKLYVSRRRIKQQGMKKACHLVIVSQDTVKNLQHVCVLAMSLMTVVA